MPDNTSNRNHPPRGGKPFGDKKPGGRPQGGRSFRDRPRGDKPRGDRPQGERSFGNKPRSDRPQGERSFGNKPRGDQPQGKRPFGDKPRGDRPQGSRSFGDRPRNDRPRSDRPAPSRRPDAVSPARAAAFRAIQDVLNNEAYTAMAVDRQLSQTNMTGLDRALCTALTYGTLENLLAIDHILSFYMEDLSTVEPRVKCILRMAVCQKRYMDKIPDNAIADEAVRLTRSIGLEDLTGFVNGVVRSFLRGDKEVTWPEDALERLALTNSMPLWLARKLAEHYGEDTAKTLLTYRPARRGMVLRPNMTRYTDEQFRQLLEKKVWEVTPGRVPHAWYAEGVMQLSRDRDYQSGAFSVQGEASMVCAALTGIRSGMQVLDCCAAPGGKTAYMAEMMQGTGRVYALDVHPHRVALLEAAVRRLQLDNVRPQLYDATRFKEDWTERFDVVLLDAPCTGLGEWHQKPDIRYGITEESLESLRETQKALLENCAKYVKRGGTLVYATCSILPEENELQLRAFLERHPEYTLEPLPEEIAALYPNARQVCGLQLLPGPDGDEGFFMAKLRRQD